MKFKKIASGISALALILAMSVPVFADQTISAEGSATVPVHLTTVAATFKVTVPTALPVDVAADGTITTAQDAKIINGSSAPIAVKGIKVTPTTGWTIVEFNKDFSAVKADTQEIGFQIFSQNTPTTGDHSVVISSVAKLKAINSGANVVVDYNASLPAQVTPRTNENPLNVVFTLGWAA